MNPKLKAYFEARRAYDKAVADVVDDPQVVEDIKKDFEEMYPEYYIHLIGAVTGFISASIYRKSDNRIVEAISFPNHNGTWSFKH
jgi:hypothetical protein